MFIRRARSRPSSFIQILKFSERPCIVPHEVIRLNVVLLGLSIVEIGFSGLPDQKRLLRKPAFAIF
jgi:hypothetical protein